MQQSIGQITPVKRWVVVARPWAYGTVAVFQDLYGNLWDLIQTKV